MSVVDAGNDEETCSLPNHISGDAWPRVKFLALETPTDNDWHVALRDYAGQLCIDSRIDNR